MELGYVGELEGQGYISWTTFASSQTKLSLNIDETELQTVNLILILRGFVRLDVLIRFVAV